MAHFLSGVLDGDTPFSLRVERTGAVLGDALVLAGTSAARRQGLLGRDGLAPGGGLIIAPSQGIHTFGMRFPLDIICVTREGAVVKVRAAVPPRRVVLSWAAFAIVEMAAGEAGRAGLAEGDVLEARR